MELNQKKSQMSRRDFVVKGSMAGIVGSVIPMNDLKGKERPSNFKLSQSTKSLMDLLKITCPIVQAPAGGVVTPELTAAVSSAGALGGLPLTWTASEGLPARIGGVTEKTDRPFFANYVMDMRPATLSQALQLGVPVIQFSWGMPTKEEAKLVLSKGILGIQVTSEASAKQALNLGAQYLVCQGMEAGGHVQASRLLSESLERVLSVAGDVPVVASGGIATGSAMRTYLDAGAAGVVMGSRFVASKESGAHEDYKKELLKASAEDTVYTVCNNRDWPNAMHRIIRNSTFEMWEAAGCPPEGSRPGEDDICAISEYSEVKRYGVQTPHVGYKGNIEAMALYAGKGVGEINTIRSASSIVETIWAECQTI
ncbi:MAG: nitronate monooxygenase [Reichenbachiella sp.]